MVSATRRLSARGAGVSATGGAAVYDADSNAITWSGAVAAGASVTVTFDVTVDEGIPVGVVIENIGTVSYDSDGDGDYTDETLSVIRLSDFKTRSKLILLNSPANATSSSVGSAQRATPTR